MLHMKAYEGYGTPKQAYEGYGTPKQGHIEGYGTPKQGHMLHMKAMELQSRVT